MASVAQAQETALVSKDYVVFLGIDLFADPNNELERLPVVGGSSGEIVVLDESGTSVIPRSKAVITATLEPKVSRGEVTLERMEGRPVYSPNTNPATKELAQMMALQSVDEGRRDAADRAAFRARMAVNAAGAEAAATPAAGRAAAESRFNQATAAAAAAASEVGEAAGSSVLSSNLPLGFEGNGGHDGFEVTFRVSAAEHYSDAYGVLQLTIHEPLHPELGKQHAFQVFDLPDIGPKPRKVSVTRLRLPRGFMIDSYEVHVYVADTELATNTSRNRVEVTKAEALQFLILQHTHRNKGASLDPQVVQELRPEWPRAKLAGDWEHITVNLRITPEGMVEETNVAGGISNPLTDELSAAVRDVVFLPALAVGKPVPGTGRFALGELFRAPLEKL